MMHAPSGAAARRPGIILLVVLALLTLFAILGISFVLYANASATASRYFREGETAARPDVEPEQLLNYFLGQLLFDAPDDERGVYSALRGHSLARNMYGANYRVANGAAVYVDDHGAWLNAVPFNGTGRLRVDPVNLPPTFSRPLAEVNGETLNDYHLINYTQFKVWDSAARAWVYVDKFVHDPERPDWRDPGSQPEPNSYSGGFNAPYTYPDLNNVFLAAVTAGALDLGDGHVVPPGALLTPSFYRPWLFRHGVLDQLGTGVGTFDRRNPNWTNAEGKYMILRPRPIDQKRNPGDPNEPERFPYPEDEGGDVKNLIGAPGYYDPVTGRVCNNDSMWLDLDFPVMTAPDGRKFKPLFAPLVLDLDNRINLNVHGNLRGENYATHASNQGWGPWEVNPAKVLDYNPVPSQDPREWTSLLAGAPGRGGRYGPFGVPVFPENGGDNRAPLPGPSRHYAPADFDGSNELAGGLPTERMTLPDYASPRLRCFPDFPVGYGTDPVGEALYHPGLFNPFRPRGRNRAFALSDMEALLRYGDTGTGGLTSDLFHLCPHNFGDPGDAVKRRGLVTVASFDVDRPGVTPYFWPANFLSYNRLVPLSTDQRSRQPFGVEIPFPLPGELGSNVGYSEFGSDLRTTSLLTSLRRVDLNRYLPDYPPVDSSGMFTDPEQTEVATRARQYMALEIFDVLWKVTGAGSLPASAPANLADETNPAVQRFNALRALAQLAVNIVDFIDSDDVMTPFNWYTDPTTGSKHWVYGTELPRVVVNEAYAENVGNQSSVWIELYNPLSRDPNLTFNGAARLQSGDPTSPYPVYQLVIPNQTDQLQAPYNVLGDAVGSVMSDFTGAEVIPPSDGRLSGAGYYVIAPGPIISSVGDEIVLPNLRRGLVPTAGNASQTTVLLRRLACPYLRPGPENPYVTIDYMDGIQIYRSDTPEQNRTSRVRQQPFAAASGLLVPETAPNPSRRQHSMGRANFNRAPQFDWLVHLDRKLISPLELLQVSAYKPHELTHQFMTSQNGENRFQQRAAWFDEDLPNTGSSDTPSHRLYRALEFLGTRSQVAGMMVAGTVSPKPVERSPGVNGPPTAVYPVQMAGVSFSGGTWEIRPGVPNSSYAHDDRSPERLYLVPEVPQSLVIDQGKTDPTGRPLDEVVLVQEVIVSEDAASHVRTPIGFTAFFRRDHDSNFTITPVTISDRVPGKVNLNTVWDKEVFRALCDTYLPQRSNNFIPEEVDQIFNNLLRSRTPNLIPGKPNRQEPNLKDRPFLSSATGLTRSDSQALVTGGLGDTLLRANSDQGGRRLLELDRPEHPYLADELMTKVFNNVTNRSNVFAVWLTVGFFEVTGAESRPVKLGAELGRAENRQMRHRMFAIVDRTRLTANPGPQPRFDLRAAPPQYTTGLVVPYFSIID